MEPVIIIIALIIGLAYVVGMYMDRFNFRKEYRSALSELEKDPKNPKLRRKALEAGRKYFGSCRIGATTQLDEQVIANDINAATGGD